MKKLINKLNQRLRSSLSIMVLSLCTVFLFFSNSAAAQTFSGGTGLQTDPYLISNPEDLVTLSNYTNGNGVTATNFSGKYFKMTNDINMASVSNFAPIGIYDGSEFAGTFNGQNNKITNLTINNPATGGVVGVGLFGSANGSNISNIIITHANITSAFANVALGGLIGVMKENVVIQNCCVINSTISSSASASIGIGGLIGLMMDVATVNNSYCSNTSVTGICNEEIGYGVGGLVGTMVLSCVLRNCYANVTVSSPTSTTHTDYGGLFGKILYEDYKYLFNCYYINTWKGSNINSTPAANSTFTAGGSTIYSKTAAEMQASSFVSSTGAAGTTLNLSTNNPSGATLYQVDYSSPLTLNNGFPIITDVVFNGGSGTSSEPYLISNPAGLIEFSNYVNGNVASAVVFSGKYFKMTNDIDMSSITNFTPIGNGKNSPVNAFKGIFDGNNNKVLNLKEDATCYGVGLFGVLINATVKNLGIIGADIKATSTTTANIGAVAGGANGSNIINCYVRNSTVRVNCSIGGGLVGIIVSGTHIYNCYTSGTTIELQRNITKVGGLIGWCSSATTTNTNIIQNCYSTSVLTSTTTNNNTTIGGIYGDIFPNWNVINNCYYRTDWKGTNLTGTPTENSNLTTTTASTNHSTVYSKSLSDMQLDNFVLSTGAAGTTLNLASTVVSGAITYKADYAFVINHGFPIFTTEQMISPYIIKNGEKIVVPSGTAITDIPSVIIIKDGGQLLNNSTNALNNVTVEKTLKVGAWNLIGSVLQNNNIIALNSNVGETSGLQHDMAALAYDYTTNRWSTTYLGVNTGFDNQFALGDSYMVWPLSTNISGTAITPSDNYITVSQTSSTAKPLLLNTSNFNASPIHNVVPSLAYNGGIWGAFSNPYTANVTTNAFINEANNPMIIQGGALYFWDADNNAWITNLSTNNKYTLQADGTYTTTTGTPKTIIKPAEGFMIAETDNARSYIGNQIFVNLPKPTAAKSSIKTNNDLITFATIANNTTKEAFARINEQASNDFDQNDAFVMFSNNSENLVEPYFASNNKMLLKDEFKTLPYVAPINFHASKVSNTDLTVSNIPNEIKVSIVDLASGNETELTNGSAFNFTANEGENEGRFVVKFGKTNVSIENTAEENNISLAMYPNPATSQTTLFVDGLTNNAQVSICDVQGRTINTYTINKNQSTLKINTENLSSGVYYIRVVSNNLTKTEKLVVK